MSTKQVKFTKHSLLRARERKLWKYVSKDKFFYDAYHLRNHMAKLDECIYVYKYEGDDIKILTMYSI